MTLLADGPLAQAIGQAGLDTLSGALAYMDGDDLDKPGLARRRRTRIELADSTGTTHTLYLKRYGRERLRGRLWLLLTGRGRAGPARRESDNIQAVRDAGVATMRCVAFGEQPGLLGAKCGYLLVTQVPGDALERIGAEYLSRADSRDQMRFTESLAALVGRLHSAGLVHRDLYASHIFLDPTAGPDALALIDLARVFRPRWRRRRWVVKDLSQLYYSMPRCWRRLHWSRLLRQYAGRESPCLDRAIRTKARRIRLRAIRKRRQAQADQ